MRNWIFRLSLFLAGSLIRQSNKRQSACCGFAKSIFLVALAFRQWCSSVRTRALPSSIWLCLSTHIVSCLAVGLICTTLHLQAEETLSKEDQMVVLETNLGVIEMKLFTETAPKACENFMKLIEKHYYDGVIFHRVIKSFMIQCGDPTGTGAGGASIWGQPFADECSLKLKFDRPGLLAMANRGPNTNGSQFFITTAEAPWLNMKHTIFGEVTKGYEIVQKIERAKTMQDRPVEQITIVKAHIPK